MSLGHGSRIVTDGLQFAYDMGSKQSWKGKPTTNYIVSQNAIQETSYAPHEYTTSGTWLQKHPNAIIAHNSSGGTLSSYVNTGVGDWTNTYHAHWQYDEELRKPVVVMEDFDGQWKAKSFSTGQSFTSMGLAAGDTYTISWLQWTDNLSKIANAGLYMRTTGGTNGFHAGQASSHATAFNTKLHTWQRVYATFTVPTGMNMTNTNSIYMYGHYTVRATVKVADVQFETGSVSGYSPVTTRSAADCLIDWAGSNAITLNNLSYDTDGSFSFNGSSNYLDGDLSSATTMYCLDLWVYNNNTIPNNDSAIGGPSTYQTIINFNRGVSATPGVNLGGWTSGATNEAVHIWGNTDGGGTGYNGMTYTRDSVPTGWHHMAFNWNGSYYDIWVDGVKSTVYAHTNGHASLTTLNSFRLGRNAGGSYYFNGKIAACKIYGTQLSDNEVKQNFNALRGRFGI